MTVCFGALFDISFTIFALAVGTKRCLFNFGCAAAIAFVPVATGIVVDIIAHSVTNVCVATFALDNFARTFIFCVFVFTIQAFTCFAIFFLTRIAADTTAVTFVPTAARIVVLVIANAVSNEVWQLARTFDVFCTGIRFGCKCAVAALARFAVVIVIGSTTVSSIPSATSIVVIVITRLVALPGWLDTSFFDCRDAFVTLWFVLAIRALAFFAVFVLIALATDTTAISVIPGTPGVVVIVVAEAITDKVLCAASTLDFVGAFIAFVLKTAIQTQAFLAISVVVLVPTAIPSIPGATGVVVLVIAILVSLPCWLSTLRFNFPSACVTDSLVVAVFAFAFFAETISLCTTTVTAVPIASTIIVVIIAISIAGVLCRATFAFATNLSTSIGFIRDVIGVEAQATGKFSLFVFFFRVAILQGSRGRAAAIASVPGTTTDVVGVVAIAVTFPRHISTLCLACFRRWSYKSRILAFAFFAPLVLGFSSAAITVVPPTFAVVVVVVAEFVTRPRGVTALGFVRS